ncbi:MAG: efflux RND transporter permease subunit [Acidobacteriota bacterium]
MRKLIAQSVRRPVAVSMIYVALALLAVAAWINLPMEVEITGNYPSITVRTGWGMAAPEAVQALITSPIESIAVTIPGVTHVTSQSSRGNSLIRIELAEDANVDLVVFELSDRLTLLRDDMPPGSNPPVVTRDAPRQFQQEQRALIEYLLLSPRDLSDLRRWAIEELQVRFESIDGVGRADIRGGTDPFVRVTVNSELAELYGIQAYDVLNAIQQINQTMPLGQVEMLGTAYAVRVQQTVEDLDRLRQLPITRVGDTTVRISDIGTVEMVHEPAEQFVRVNGEQRVLLSIFRRPGTDTLEVAQAVRARMAQVERELPPDIRVEPYSDQAEDLEAELALLGRRLIVILVLVGVLLLAMLRDLRTPLFLGLSLAAALSLTIIALYHFEVPVNLLTLTGLALAFGMLVDNAVVVLENIVRYREQGLPAQEAAERGTAEVIVPVLAATLTTVAVFGPFVIFQGRLRDYYLPLALAVTFALASSFFVAMTLMPAAAGRGWVLSAPRFGREPGKWYRKGLGFGLRHPFIILAIVCGIGWYSWNLFNENVPSGRFYFGSSRDRLYVRLTLPEGTEAARIEEEIRPFEQYALSVPDTERVELSVDVANNYATLLVTFPPEVETTAYPLLVKDEMVGMATRYAGVSINVSGFDQDPYYSSGLSYGPSYNSGIHLFGYNYDELGRIGEEIARIASRHPRVEEATVTAGGQQYYRSVGSELVLTIDRDALVPHGVSVQQVIYQISSLVRGNTSQLRGFKVGPEEWVLRVKNSGVDRRTLQEVLDQPLLGAGGRGARLRDVLHVETREVPGVITRDDQRYDRWVRWEYRGSSRARANYETSIFDSLRLPPGYSAEKDSNSYFLTEEEELQIRMVAYTALVIIFIILASLYESLIQPFIVLLTVPSAMIGVFLIFYFTGKAFDPSARIGVVLLSGIVVNNAIILVDHINLRRKQGLELLDGIVTGAAERVRPILVTSITTIGGLLPLVIVQGSEQTSGNQDMWSNLALSTIGGLTVATLLTLSVTPILYLLAERGRARARRFVAWVGRVWKELPA